MPAPRSPALSALAALTLGACSFTGTATHWNGRLDPEGRPVFMKATTNIGINLLVFIPVLGNITLDEMLDYATAEIAAKNGTRVRVTQAGSTNYSQAFIPLTYLVTPISTEIYLEYEPSWDELVEQLGLEQALALRPPPAPDAAGPDQKPTEHPAGGSR
ncbi:MAG: hypothetical protein H6835_18405 [Planctomycetes bacterium]|nr:hypothetical protein [Planctomycetota bacterium]